MSLEAVYEKTQKEQGKLQNTLTFKQILVFFQRDPSFFYYIIKEIIKDSKNSLSCIRDVSTILSLISMLRLNQKPFIEWSPTGKDNEIELKDHDDKESAKKSPLSLLSHTYGNKNHATVLIPGETTPQTLIDWVKATQREQDTGITLTPTYISSWM